MEGFCDHESYRGCPPMYWLISRSTVGQHFGRYIGRVWVYKSVDTLYKTHDPAFDRDAL